MHIGCHVSIAGGINKAPQRAADLGCEVMQIFTRSPQGGASSELTPEICKKFKLLTTCLPAGPEPKWFRAGRLNYQLQTVFVHSPYYINFASAKSRLRYGSVKILRDELERASLIGAKFVMTHLGTAKDLGQKEALKKTSQMLKKVLEGYSGSTKLLLENSAGAGEIIGDDLKELGEIIKNVDDKNIAGICLDTQHSFASGYDWRDFENTLKRIDSEIGLEKIKLIHANDSLSECGSNKDRHAHIGEGLIGAEAFQKIVSFAEKNGIDMILETQHDKVREDIELLKKMRENG